MRFEHRKWVIITLAAYDEDELKNICGYAIQSGYSTLRKTLDGTKAILKWDGDTPSVFDGMTTYTHSEIRVELKKAEWNSDA